MKKLIKSKPVAQLPARVGAAGYDLLLADVAGLLEAGRRGAARAVNSVMTAVYWRIGQRIVEYHQAGDSRAEYGEEILDRLARDLSAKYGRGFSRSNVAQMRAFYDGWEIVQTPSGQFQSQGRPHAARVPSATSDPDGQTEQRATSFERRPLRLGKHLAAVPLETPGEPSAVNVEHRLGGLKSLVAVFPLPWSHYVRLMSVKDNHARRFYETEALRGGWTVRQLHRQINSLFYERTALSKNKAAMLAKGQRPIPADSITPEEEIKDPLVLEFLALKDEYSESDMEEALIHHLEIFLLELGDDFSFVGRQRRLRIGDQWFRVDLLFFHRKLRCLIVIDLKTGEFTHADAGQMHLYLNYALEHWAKPGENPPVGLILCAQKDAAVARYALDNLPNKVLAAEYKLELPKEKLLVSEIEKTRSALEARSAVRPPRTTA